MEVLTTQLTLLKVLFLRGLIPTLELVPLALALSVGVGLLGGMLRVMRIPVIDRLIWFYIYVMRGLPMLVILFLTYYVLPTGNNPRVAATIALVSCHGAYMIEIFRSGFEAVTKGQREAGRALGMNFWQRMTIIILPQAILVIVPAAVGQLIILVKDTALTSIIGYVEITRMGRNLMQTIMEPVPIFLYIAIYYFAVCHLLKLLANWIERVSHANLGASVHAGSVRARPAGNAQ